MKVRKARKGLSALGAGALAWSLLPLGALALAACGSDNDNPVPPVAETPAPAPGPAPSPAPAPVAAALALGGAIERPWTLTLADLQALEPTTQTVNYAAGSTPQTRTYTGTLLWPLIDAAGVEVDATRSNDILNHYVVARGADDYRAVFALGELMPNFGNRQSLVVYSETRDGTVGPLAADDGPLRVTSPGDVRGGRYVSQLVGLDVMRSTSTVAAGNGEPSTELAASGAILRPGNWDRAALLALPAATATVGESTYTGVDLWTFVNDSLGLDVDAAAHNPALSMYLVGTGSDGYKAVVSLGEIHPNFGNQKALIAYDVNGAALDSNGFARLVLPGDTRQGRSVSMLIGLEVLRATTP